LCFFCVFLLVFVVNLLLILFSKDKNLFLFLWKLYV
jgi:hypothetical protein